MTHEIKSHPAPFRHRWIGVKPWEHRLNDRKYAVGDFLHEREWSPEKGYSGRSILSKIVCLYDGKYIENRGFGISRSHCIMTLETIAQGPQ